MLIATVPSLISALMRVRHDPIARAGRRALGPQAFQVGDGQILEAAVQDDARRHGVVLKFAGERQLKGAAMRQDFVDRQMPGGGVEGAAEFRFLKRQAAAVEHDRRVDEDVLRRPVGRQIGERAVGRERKVRRRP